MTPRAQKAIEIMTAGGYIRRALETQYRGGEKFEYRLRDKDGVVVKGFGFATYHELEQLRLLSSRQCPRSTVWPMEWTLSGIALQPAA